MPTDDVGGVEARGSGEGICLRRCVPQFNMKSYHRFIGFSNNPDPATKNKRRDVFFRSSDKIGNTEYFGDGFYYAKDMNCCKYIYEITN